jgi:hypothetical protein
VPAPLAPAPRGHQLADDPVRTTDRPHGSPAQPQPAVAPAQRAAPVGRAGLAADRLLLTRSRWLSALVPALAVWGCGWLLLLSMQAPSAAGFARLDAVAATGLWTLAWYATRRWWRPLAARWPVALAGALGVAGGVLVEVVFWAAGHAYRAGGLATRPDLAIALAVTLPWYVLLVRSFVLAQRRRRFPLAQVLLLGALYRLGADAVVKGLLLDGVLLRADVWQALGVAWFWQFIVVYSPVVAVPAMALAAEPAGQRDPGRPGRAWLDALRPFGWLAVYLGFVAVAALVTRALG